MSVTKTAESERPRRRIIVVNNRRSVSQNHQETLNQTEVSFSGKNNETVSREASSRKATSPTSLERERVLRSPPIDIERALRSLPKKIGHIRQVQIPSDPLLKESEFERKENERREVEKRENERREVEKREVEKREVERKELERKELERKELERKELERKENERRELEKRELERKELEKRELERKELEKREVEKRELEKRELEKRELEKRELEKRENERREVKTAERKIDRLKTASKESFFEEEETKIVGASRKSSRESQKSIKKTSRDDSKPIESVRNKTIESNRAKTVESNVESNREKTIESVKNARDVRKESSREEINKRINRESQSSREKASILAHFPNLKGSDGPVSPAPSPIPSALRAGQTPRANNSLTSRANYYHREERALEEKKQQLEDLRFELDEEKKALEKEKEILNNRVRGAKDGLILEMNIKSLEKRIGLILPKEYPERLECYRAIIREFKKRRFRKNSRRLFLFICVAVEFGMTDLLGISCGGFANDQMGQIYEYDDILDELGEKWFFGEGASMAPEIRLSILFTFNLFLFIVGNYALKLGVVGQEPINAGKDAIRNLVAQTFLGVEAPEDRIEGLNAPASGAPDDEIATNTVKGAETVIAGYRLLRNPAPKAPEPIQVKKKGPIYTG